MNRGTILVAAAIAAASVLGGGSAQGRTADADGQAVEVVVTLAQPALHGRSLASAAGARVARQQAAFRRALLDELPEARVRWRYRTVLNGLAVVVPERDVARLARLPGVQRVYKSVRFRSRLYQSPQLIGAPQLWGPTLATAGDGIKIGIIDDGLDQSHVFLSPRGYTMPAGFPKGQTEFTTAKVIVARAFAPVTPTWKYANRPFDPEESFHATHVAGIAAGNNATPATLSSQSYSVSGIAPRAYIGNYKALTIPTPGFGLDGNSPEIAAAIEAAVNDGMNVINLSLGEPEISQDRDLVVRAIEGAASAGVVPVVAAGNDYDEFGRGSVGSPGGAPSAITVAASTKAGTVASFSSSGPSPISFGMKPDVTAPGSDILSSVPSAQGTWAVYQGTSMASPHVAGAAGLLKQRHPAWTVQQIKSALEQTAVPVYTDGTKRTEAPTTRQGGGLINLPRADVPLLFAAPTGLSFGLVKPGAAPLVRTVELTDAGGGAGPWTAALVEQQTHDPAVDVTVAAAATVPGPLAVSVTVRAGAAQVEHTGFVVLTRGADTRRIPYWFFVESPKLGPPSATLTRAGTYSGNTAGRAARVSTYRYPDDPSGAGVARTLDGPEQVFRVRISGPVANFGVAVVSGGRIEPRVVVAGDENRLTGYVGLPLNLNPYTTFYGRRQPVAGAVLPDPGLYDVVFDSATAAQAGKFTFRLWIGDTKAPTLKLLARTVRRGAPLAVAATDAGAGVDPGTIVARLDGKVVAARLVDGKIAFKTAALKRGRHTLTMTVSDYQEAKNMEDVGPILPNTRSLRTTFVVR